MIACHFGLIEEDLRLHSQYTAGHGVVELAKSRVRVRDGLRRALRDPAFDGYDHVLIDCPPNLNITTRVALMASSHVVTPTRPDYLSTIGLRYLFESYSRVVAAHAEDLTILGAQAPGPMTKPQHLGVLFTMVQFSGPDRPYAKQQQAMQQFRDAAGLPLFSSLLRYNNSLYGDAGDGGVPVALLDSVNPDVAADIDLVGTEFLKRLSNNEGIEL